MNRRRFMQMSSTAGLSLMVPGIQALAQAAVTSPSSRVRVAMLGTNSRGAQLTSQFASLPNVEIAYICDPEDKAAEKGVKAVPSEAATPKVVRDFRRALDDKDVDAIVIAMPDHWHAPATLMGLQAGKHVYVEKPCGHNSAEGELLIAAQKKYPKLKIQMGNQRRSSELIAEAVQAIQEGVIGRAYHGKAWYSNKRGSIGRGKQVPVPSNLDFELWQGPAPRVPYKDNIVHYNWHWFWNWGTGESCNNATHEFDVCRWALGVDYPERVTSSGGRYRYDDDWEFWDTQLIGLEYPDRKLISWEGHSCNRKPQFGMGRGSIIYGENGSMLIDTRFYRIYDAEDKLVKEVNPDNMSQSGDGTDTKAPTQNLTKQHCLNFVECIRDGKTPNAEIVGGHQSILMCHLGNIAQKMGQSLTIDPSNGRILNNPEAMKMWGREYEKGWEPKI